MLELLLFVVVVSHLLELRRGGIFFDARGRKGRPGEVCLGDGGVDDDEDDDDLVVLAGVLVSVFGELRACKKVSASGGGALLFLANDKFSEDDDDDDCGCCNRCFLLAPRWPPDVVELLLLLLLVVVLLLTEDAAEAMEESLGSRLREGRPWPPLRTPKELAAAKAAPEEEDAAADVPPRANCANDALRGGAMVDFNGLADC